jgi:outer membrane protein
MRTSHASLLCIAVIFSVLSQVARSAAEEGAPRRPQQQGWSVGPLLLVVDQPYRGKSSRSMVVPAIGYEGKTVFLRGLRFGVHLKSKPQITTDFLVQPRFAGFKASDIAAIPNLEDRRDSMDAGLDMRVALTGASAIRITVLADVLGRSNGQELDLRYGYLYRHGRARVTPWFGGRWLSGNLADYYYGTLSSEVSAGAPPYQPGAVVLPQVGVSIFTPLGRSKWTVFTLLAASFFPNRLSDSPLLDGDTATIIIAGISYHL